jgi:hypothetical protein
MDKITFRIALWAVKWIMSKWLPGIHIRRNRARGKKEEKAERADTSPLFSREYEAAKESQAP